MNATFGAAYARLYDDFYAAKDYEAECDRIESVFRCFARGSVQSILDLGCGTGNHALPLARRGYAVTGLDRSATMLERARAKAEASSAPVRWLRGDVRAVDAGATFDAALLMFGVLGYQHSNDDVRATFGNIRRHLLPGGLLVFDAWHGPGVIADPPADGERLIETSAGSVVRRASTSMDVRHHLCRVSYRISRGAEPVSDETHIVRYFFPMELDMYLQSSGFRLLEMRAFDAPEREPDLRDWNVFVVAQAV